MLLEEQSFLLGGDPRCPAALTQHILRPAGLSAVPEGVLGVLGCKVVSIQRSGEECREGPGGHLQHHFISGLLQLTERRNGA